ncbi:MAG: serine/threonine protein kinase [Deltaproteobacteria bacterium]|nr:serine/threonine protein kinase [Deltaproteobacteria bacterium]
MPGPLEGSSIPESLEPFEGALPPDPEVGEVIGGYELLKVLGKGGAGSVFRARALDDGAVVSLKVLASSKLRKARLVRRFLDEARTASMVSHPSLVRLIEFIDQEDPRRLAYAMEFVDGESLREKLNRERALDLASAIRIVLQICDGVDALHESGIIHRDLKPENIMLVGDPNSPKVKLLDYGVAKVVGSESDDSESPGTFVGTPRYMAPEQAAGGSVDPRSDLFAIGVIIFEMVTGKRPHEGDSLKAVVMAKLQGAPRVTINPDKEVLPKGLSDAVDACLKLQPASRPDSAKALRTSLDEALAVLYVVGSVRLGQDGVSMVRVHSTLSAPGSAASAPAEAAAEPAAPKPPSKLALALESMKARLRERRERAAQERAAKQFDPNSLGVRASAFVKRVGPKKVMAAAVGAVAVGSIVVVVIAIFMRDEKKPERATDPVGTSTAARTSTVPERPKAPRTPHAVNVSTRPSGALIFAGSSTIGQTPTKLVVPPDADELRVEIRLEGYRPLPITISRSTSADLRLEMPPLPVDKTADAAVVDAAPDAAIADASPAVKGLKEVPPPTADAGASNEPAPIPKEVLDLLKGSSEDDSSRRRRPQRRQTPPSKKPPTHDLPPADAIP